MIFLRPGVCRLELFALHIMEELQDASVNQIFGHWMVADCLKCGVVVCMWFWAYSSCDQNVRNFCGLSSVEVEIQWSMMVEIRQNMATFSNSP